MGGLLAFAERNQLIHPSRTARRLAGLGLAGLGSAAWLALASSSVGVRDGWIDWFRSAKAIKPPITHEFTSGHVE